MCVFTFILLTLPESHLVPLVRLSLDSLYTRELKSIDSFKETFSKEKILDVSRSQQSGSMRGDGISARWIVLPNLLAQFEQMDHVDDGYKRGAVLL